MAFGDVAARYAQAAFESAKQANEIDSVLEQVSLVSNLINSSPELERLLRNPDVSAMEKKELLARAAGEKLSDSVMAFMYVVLEFGRAEFFGQIVEALSALVDKEKGIVRALVRSAFPVSEEQLTRLRGILSSSEGKQVIMTQQTDKSLIGGIEVHIAGRVFDNSLKRHLKDLREDLTTIKVY